MRRLLLIVLVTVLAHAAWGQSKPRAATLAQQKTCAEQAAKAFHAIETPADSDELHVLLWEYTNHYSTEKNVCYFMTKLTMIGTPKSATLRSLQYGIYDAFENRTYADFLEMIFRPESPDEKAKDEIVSCWVEVESTQCKSASEFLQLAEKRFNIAP